MYVDTYIHIYTLGIGHPSNEQNIVCAAASAWLICIAIFVYLLISFYLVACLLISTIVGELLCVIFLCQHFLVGELLLTGLKHKFVSIHFKAYFVFLHVTNTFLIWLWRFTIYL